jgi:hypothetical protein
MSHRYWSEELEQNKTHGELEIFPMMTNHERNQGASYDLSALGLRIKALSEHDDVPLPAWIRHRIGVIARR